MKINIHDSYGVIKKCHYVYNVYTVKNFINKIIRLKKVTDYRYEIISDNIHTGIFLFESLILIRNRSQLKRLIKFLKNK